MVYQPRFVLDVGGVFHYSTEATLSKVPRIALVIREWKQQEAEEFVVDSAPFVDRDGILFYHILSFLRNRSISNIPPDMIGPLMIEAAYFQMRDMETQLKALV